MHYKYSSPPPLSINFMEFFFKVLLFSGFCNMVRNVFPQSQDYFKNMYHYFFQCACGFVYLKSLDF